MRTPKIILAVAAALAIAAPVARAQAADRDLAGPKELIESRNKDIQTIIDSGVDEPAMRGKIVDLMESFVDYQELSRLTLKTEWDKLKPEQQKEFVGLFKKLIHRTYTKRFKANQAFHVDINGDPVLAKGRAQVRTTIKSGDTTADVNYSMFQPGAERPGWWVYDIVIDDVSLMRNYRTQFYRVIQKDGFEALLAKIRKKTDAPDDENDDI